MLWDVNDSVLEHICYQVYEGEDGIGCWLGYVGSHLSDIGASKTVRGHWTGVGENFTEKTWNERYGDTATDHFRASKCKSGISWKLRRIVILYLSTLCAHTVVSYWNGKRQKCFCGSGYNRVCGRENTKNVKEELGDYVRTQRYNGYIKLRKRYRGLVVDDFQ